MIYGFTFVWNIVNGCLYCLSDMYILVVVLWFKQQNTMLGYIWLVVSNRTRIKCANGFQSHQFSACTRICSVRIRSGVSQQFDRHVSTITLPNSSGAASPLPAKRNSGIMVGNSCSSHNVGPAQCSHGGNSCIVSGNGAIRRGIVSREYLDKDKQSSFAFC